jgi:hypothetical protein
MDGSCYEGYRPPAIRILARVARCIPSRYPGTASLEQQRDSLKSRADTDEETYRQHRGSLVVSASCDLAGSRSGSPVSVTVRLRGRVY